MNKRTSNLLIDNLIISRAIQVFFVVAESLEKSQEKTETHFLCRR